MKTNREEGEAISETMANVLTAQGMPTTCAISHFIDKFSYLFKITRLTLISDSYL